MLLLQKVSYKVIIMEVLKYCLLSVIAGIGEFFAVQAIFTGDFCGIALLGLIPLGFHLLLTAVTVYLWAREHRGGYIYQIIWVIYSVAALIGAAGAAFVHYLA